MLKVEGLTKRYGERTALDALDLALPAGQFVALLGPNGAGKSTLFQLITGLFAPTAGRIEIGGFDLRDKACAALRRSAWCSSSSRSTSISRCAATSRCRPTCMACPGRWPASASPRAASAWGWARNSTGPCGNFPAATGVEWSWCAPSLHRPRLLLMDEATVGLDPKSRRDLLGSLHADVAERGCTVLWATHWVEEALQADRVLVLHRGKLLADGSPDAVTAQLGGPTLEEAFVRATG